MVKRIEVELEELRRKQVMKDTLCRHCEEPLNRGEGFCVMRGGAAFCQGSGLSIFFHEKCFREVAGDEWTEELVGLKVSLDQVG